MTLPVIIGGAIVVGAVAIVLSAERQTHGTAAAKPETDHDDIAPTPAANPSY